MKKLKQAFALQNKYLSAVIAFTLFFVTAKAQKDTLPVTLKYGGITIDGTLIIPHQATSTTVTKATLGLDKVDNTPDIQKPISIPVQNAFNNLPNLFAAKGSAATGTTEGSIINLPEQTWWKEIRPFDYGTTYSDGSTQGSYFIGSYSTHYGVNSRSNRPDQVFQIAGYRSYPNNGQMRTPGRDASWDYSVESHYDIPTLPYAAFEFHFRMKDTAQAEHRLLSGYFNKADGSGFWNMETSSLSLFAQSTYRYIPGITPPPFFYTNLAGQQTLRDNFGNNTEIKMINSSGNTILISQAGDVSNVKIPGVLDGNGFNHLKFPGVKNFASITDAKNNGQEVNDFVTRTVVVNGETLEVLVRVK